MTAQWQPAKNTSTFRAHLVFDDRTLRLHISSISSICNIIERASEKKTHTHTAHWNVCTLTRSNVQWVEPSNQTNRTTYESYIEWARRRVQCRARAKNWQMIRFHSSMQTCGAPSQMPNVCVCVNGWYYRDMVISINQIFFVYFDHFHLARRGR